MIRSLLHGIENVEVAALRARPTGIYSGAILLLCLSVVIIGFRITSDTNHDAGPFDQSAYILMSGEMSNSAYPWYSDGTRNPLFPWLAARFLDPAAPEFFESGKKFNVLLAGLGTALLGIFFGFRMGPLAGFNATALGALAVLLPLSTFFGAEVLLLVLFLFLCVTAMRLLSTNPLWLYVVLGALAGLAYLAKSSGTLFLALFIGFSIIRLALTLFPFSRLPWAWRAPDWRIRNLFVGLALFGAIYFALIAPRLVHAHRTWGSSFYSLPGFWFWADDWETCVQKYTDCRAITLAKMTPEDQPTLAGYFRRHSIADAIERATVGAGVRIQQFFHPEKKWRFPYEKRGKPRRIVLPHRGFYILGLAALASALGCIAFARGHLPAIGPVALPILLGLVTCLLYTLAMGWYLPTGPGHRFILTLYLPVLWILAQGGDQLRLAANHRPANILFLGVHLAITVLVLTRLGTLLLGVSFEKVIYTF
jgi:hypothetical protein